ncbi:MAG: alpha/beta hydrolase-fold protein [Myxococcales bacterium]|nr:alpha/beta hydrolase-fold protein [Myxococcales bacterium]MDH3486332.1 alpha/beta hydrolase-fold protein [Myxococcales bacterium]
MHSSSLALVCSVALLGCGSGNDAATGGAGGSGGDGGSGGGLMRFDCDAPDPVNCPEMPPSAIDAERPAQVVVPSDYTTSTRYPLIVVLHGRGATGAANAIYLGASQRVEERQFVLVAPDGTQDTEGRLAWNAGAIDSVFEPEAPDDIGYVRSLIAEARKTYRLDGHRIYLLGTSNGGHLALDIICEDPASVTAVLSQAGALPADVPCADGTVSLLSVHGTEDEVVAFGGGVRESGITILSAVNLVAGFAERSGCGPLEMLANLDLVPMPPGAETRVRSYSDCDAQAESALWVVQQAPHVPDFTDEARDLWFDWMFARARPE